MAKFKVGDKVVTNKFKSNEIMLASEMVEFIGIEGEIELIYPNGGYCIHGWSWPENSLSLKKEPTMKFTPMPELKTGNRIKNQSGTIFIYIKEMQKFFHENGFTTALEYDTTTGKDTTRMSSWDILEVYEGDKYSLGTKGNHLGKLLWEYKEPEIIKTEADLLREQLDSLKAKLRELGEEE